MLRKFKRIMKDASVRDWLNLANISNLKRSVYVSDIGSRSVKIPGLEIEWPIVWLLSVFHRKHIFVPQRIPQTNHIKTGAIRFRVDALRAVGGPVYDRSWQTRCWWGFTTSSAGGWVLVLSPVSRPIRVLSPIRLRHSGRWRVTGARKFRCHGQVHGHDHVHVHGHGHVHGHFHVQVPVHVDVNVQ